MIKNSNSSYEISIDEIFCQKGSSQSCNFYSLPRARTFILLDLLFISNLDHFYVPGTESHRQVTGDLIENDSNC